MAGTSIPNATVRPITDWVEILRPFHAFQAAALIVGELNDDRDDNIASTGRSASRLGRTGQRRS